jgi:glutamate synthase (NADPH/NADH) small chain
VNLVTGALFAPAQIANYAAVFIAAGLGASPDLGIPGEDFIVDGLAFIEHSKMALADLRVGENVVVIGAGNTAIDCATVAKRCGAKKVTMVYRRTEKEMTCYAHEYEFVKNEGVEFAFLSQPLAALSSGLECIRMELGEPDSSGRPTPIPIPGSKFLIEADQIIKAIGQQKTTIGAQLGLATERGYIKVGPNFETSRKGIYAGGDCIRAKGSASTVMAAQDGKLAAAAIHSALICGARDLVADGFSPTEAAHG